MLNKDCKDLEIITQYNEYGRPENVYFCKYGKIELWGEFTILKCDECSKPKGA